MVFIPVHISSMKKAIFNSFNNNITGGLMPNMLNSSAAFNNKVYLKGHTKVAFPFYDLPHYSTVKMIQEWDDMRSMKTNCLIMLVTWHLESNDHGVFQNFDQQLHIEQVNVPPVNEILVHMEFPMMAPLLVSVLKLHNIELLMFNGGHTVDEWNVIIKKFNTNPSAWDFLFLTVGTVSLNLMVTSIAILFLQMLANQIIEYMWCLGQEETTIMYNMVVLGTVNVLIINNSEGKGEMVINNPNDDVIIEDQGAQGCTHQGQGNEQGKGKVQTLGKGQVLRD
ncbi:uncharacterized protein EDB91DRAFT_1088194 [Suillus paluster]|uniref:uncharacterized protein n=1 Tax=Suillus paluster TaxID=48578 RepID=UPI001B87F61F|nr:uncharacterized protein EDB91DRAFT_1088194 [Suillus paluster]KAG1722286.1 hypothetical protein EDB91DRAFT_1088194 [Suillus paluster]